MTTFAKTFSPAFPALLDGFFTNEVLAPKSHQNLPSANILESDEAFKIALAVPGLKKEDFKLNIHQNVLTISASQENKAVESTEKFTRKEFNYSSFKRSFTLADSINTDGIEAQYVDGILNVSLPKKEEAKPKEPRLIAVV